MADYTVNLTPTFIVCTLREGPWFGSLTQAISVSLVLWRKVFIFFRTTWGCFASIFMCRNCHFIYCL